ncbi:MAG TPA: CPBP family intramembrane glutamic endopeptidase [Acidobacteriaceae bacterium]|nr:CPBP family intramembrane glutamic endopeptidase [Acidobacteriaceae bacterium]
MNLGFPIAPAAVALIILLVPMFAFAFAGDACVSTIRNWPAGARFSVPAVLAVPYLIVAISTGTLAADWLAVYLLTPVAVAGLLGLAARLDPDQRGHWLDYVVLIPLGLAVDLRWLEPAWPHRLALLSKLILLDAGLYGFLAVRRLSGVGFDLRLRGRDWKVGLRQFLFFMPIAIGLGFAIGFLHWHGRIAHAWELPFAWVFTFVGVAVPEEVYFRGWMQNLLERRLGRGAALVVTACVFGLSHFNKRTTTFNWRYVLLAAFAGIFYGLAWRKDRRVGASAITHATIDTVWGALLK